MVVVEAAIISGAILAGAAGIQHFYDRYHRKGFYQESRKMALAAQGAVVAQLQGLRDDINGQAKAAEEAFKAAAQSVPPSAEGVPVPDLRDLQRSLGGITKGQNALTREAKRALGQSIIGPYTPLLRTFAAPLADFLEENPEMAMEIMEWPIVKKLIGKASQMAAQATGTASQTFETTGWGT